MIAMIGLIIGGVIKNFVLIAIFLISAALIFIGTGYTEAAREAEAKNMQVPSLVRDISGYSSYGLSLYSVLRMIKNEDLGPIREEVDKALTMMRNGNTIEEVSQYLERNSSPDLALVSAVLKNADNTGRAGETLQFLSTYMNERSTRQKNVMQTSENYVGLVIGSFLIFVLVMVIVDFYFLRANGHGMVLLSSIVMMAQSYVTGFYLGLVRYDSFVSGTFYAGILSLVTGLLLVAAGSL
ncbi:MAG: type II secretion system F family protein [Thermoplasma sp.]|nr:MAG: type II secretion system F family protein [Thermoplasma sp.]